MANGVSRKNAIEIYRPLDLNLVSKQNENKKRVDNHFLNPYYLPIQLRKLWHFKSKSLHKYYIETITSVANRGACKYTVRIIDIKMYSSNYTKRPDWRTSMMKASYFWMIQICR